MLISDYLLISVVISDYQLVSVSISHYNDNYQLLTNFISAYKCSSVIIRG